MARGDAAKIATRVFSLFGALAIFTSACAQQPDVPVPALTQKAAISPSVAASATTQSAAPTIASPVLPHGIALLPTLLPLAQFAAVLITLTVPVAPGQPAESVLWAPVPFRPDVGYAARVAASFGVAGDGTVGAAPGESAPWRLWLGSKILAINERSGDVLFFDPGADDGPFTPGPAQRDPADVFNRLLAPIGTSIDLTLPSAQVRAFRGTESVANSVSVMDGSWLGPGTRSGVVLFASPANPYDPVHYPGGTIYDSDELALLTSSGRPVEIVHRPFGTLSGGQIYPVTPYGQAAAELRADPKRFLRFLSAPPGEAVTLQVPIDGARGGYAWGGGAPGDLTRARRTLVPVWEFVAEGTSTSGRPVSAMFTVDAVVLELRMPTTSSALATDADALLRRQLSVSLGGHEPWRMSAAEVARDELRGLGLAASTTPAVTLQDTDTALVTATDGSRSVGFTLRHAFPGLPNSIWYLSEARK